MNEIEAIGGKRIAHDVMVLNLEVGAGKRLEKTRVDIGRENAPELPLSLVVGLLPPATFAAGDDVRPYFEDGIRATGTIGALRRCARASNVG